MTNTIIIKKDKGQPIKLNAEQVEHNIILTKSGDKASDSTKRKIIIEPMDVEIYKQFIQIEVKQSVGQQIIEFIKRKI